MKKTSIKQMRIDKNLTVTEAASISNISYPSLLNYESAATIPNVIVVIKLLSLYERSFDELDLSPWENKK